MVFSSFFFQLHGVLWLFPFVFKHFKPALGLVGHDLRILALSFSWSLRKLELSVSRASWAQSLKFVRSLGPFTLGAAQSSLCFPGLRHQGRREPQALQARPVEGAEEEVLAQRRRAQTHLQTTPF